MSELMPVKHFEEVVELIQSARTRALQLASLNCVPTADTIKLDASQDYSLPLQDRTETIKKEKRCR